MDLFAPPTEPELQERLKTRPLRRGDWLRFTFEFNNRTYKSAGRIKHIIKANRRARVCTIKKYYGFDESHPDFALARQKYLKDRIVVKGMHKYRDRLHILILKPYYALEHSYDTIHSRLLENVSTGSKAKYVI